nr:winged helix-turn-helix domain-containing protein [Serratia proteamaculans]
MKYIINLTVVFDPESRLLILRNNDQLTIGLSNPATRLLTELIRNNKIELTRETLIKHVWEDYGFSPSSATLSNHISELRKAFEAIGVSKDILLTVPRIGFKMDAEIHPETKQPKVSVPAEQAELPPPAHSQAAEGNVAADVQGISSKKASRKVNMTVSSIFIILVVTSAAAVWVSLSKNEHPALIGIQDKCHIYTLDERKHEPEQASRAKKMLIDEGIDCAQTNRDIYYMEARSSNNLLKVYFMAACKNNNMSYTNCSNFKRVE